MQAAVAVAETVTVVRDAMGAVAVARLPGAADEPELGAQEFYGFLGRPGLWRIKPRPRRAAGARTPPFGPSDRPRWDMHGGQLIRPQRDGEPLGRTAWARYRPMGKHQPLARYRPCSWRCGGVL